MCQHKYGGKRLIVNLRQLNAYIDALRFKYEGIYFVVEQIKPNDILQSADLQDDFFHVKIRECYQKYIGVCWKNAHYVWYILPQGLSSSPYYFL